MALCDWLYSLSIILPRFIHVYNMYQNILLLPNVSLYGCVLHFVYHLSLGGHLGCFCFLAIMKNMAMDICGDDCFFDDCLFIIFSVRRYR